ncbi:MAG: glycosyltransferase family 39 protein [Candidatus Hydrogenedentes bacterium]|nr:glycosyltransferase family 39 protein [Candidatus Hydrogenedentota bacterium]
MRRSWLILTVILIVAGFLRFYDITSTGVYSVDESRSMMDARAKYEELRVIGGLFAGKWREMHGGPEFLLSEYLPKAHATLEKHQPVFPKFLMSYLGALAMFIWGFTPWTGNFIEAIFGMACVVALYFYAKQLTSRRVALLAAAMLAVSCYHVYYSRNTYCQTMPLFWWILAFHVHTRWGRRAWRKPRVARWKQGRLLWSGIFAGLAVLSSWQIIPALLALFVAHGLICMRQRTWRKRFVETVRGGAIIAVGLSLPILLVELANYPMFLLFRSAGLLYPHTTFIETIIDRFAYHATRGWHPTGVVVFPYFIGRCEGWVTLWILIGLLIAGLIHIGNRLRWNAPLRKSPRIALPAIYLGSAFLVPFVLYSAKTIVAARVHGLVWPFLLTIIAMGVVAMWRADRSRRQWRCWVIAGALTVALGSSLANCARVFELRSAYPEVLAWLRAQGETTISSSWQGPVSWYLTCEDMDQPWEAPHHYFVTDWQELFYSRYPEESKHLKAGAEPVAMFQHRFDRMFLEIEAIPHEPTEPIRDLIKVRELNLDRARQVPVYKISDTVLTDKPTYNTDALESKEQS